MLGMKFIKIYQCFEFNAKIDVDWGKNSVYTVKIMQLQISVCRWHFGGIVFLTVR